MLDGCYVLDYLGSVARDPARSTPATPLEPPVYQPGPSLPRAPPIEYDRPSGQHSARWLAQPRPHKGRGFRGVSTMIIEHGPRNVNAGAEEVGPWRAPGERL